MALIVSWIFLTENFQSAYGCDPEGKDDLPAPECSVGNQSHSAMSYKVQENSIIYIDI